MNFFFYLNFIKTDFEIKIIRIFVIVAAITKRAQIPFSSWLPAAIAAPTPVSALVHSSTLVTAGVYLLIRFNLLINFYIFSKILLVLGRLTIFISGIRANFEIDLKKIIALSTLRQLGLIIRVLSIGYYKLAFFHLLTHALFKALLFLCAGAFIHNIINFQDIRLSGNFFNQIPLTSICFNISKLTLCGIPFLAGFYSKDLILETICLIKINLFIFIIFFVSTSLTVSYSFRIIFYVSIISINNFSILSLSDETWLILKAILTLTFFAVIGGRLLRWIIFPFITIIILPLYLKFLTLTICILGGLFGYFFYRIFIIIYKKYLNVKNFRLLFISLIWFMPILSTLKLNKFFLKYSEVFFKNFDFGWRELIGGILFNNQLKILSKFLETYNYNQLKLILIRYLIFVIIFRLIFI